MPKERTVTKEQEKYDPDWNDENKKTCPQGYPWACWMCNRKGGRTIPCSGR